MTEATEPAYTPNSIVVGDSSAVRVLTKLAPSGCQVLPPFAQVYGGDYDVEADANVLPHLCWRHLVQLGDTHTLVVRPLLPQ